MAKLGSILSTETRRLAGMPRKIQKRKEAGLQVKETEVGNRHAATRSWKMRKKTSVH